MASQSHGMRLAYNVTGCVYCARGTEPRLRFGLRPDPYQKLPESTPPTSYECSHPTGCQDLEKRFSLLATRVVRNVGGTALAPSQAHIPSAVPVSCLRFHVALPGPSKSALPGGSTWGRDEVDNITMSRDQVTSCPCFVAIPIIAFIPELNSRKSASTPSLKITPLPAICDTM